MEQWRPLPVAGYERHYQVSNLGRLRSLGFQAKILSPRTYENGYIKANLTNNAGITKILRGVHRLVALAFIPNPENKPCINHIDNNPANNRVENLEWVTHQENMDHMTAQNRHVRGEKSPNAKLSEEKVRYIRASQAASRALGRELGVSESTVRSVRAGHSWAHVD